MPLRVRAPVEVCQITSHLRLFGDGQDDDAHQEKGHPTRVGRSGGSEALSRLHSHSHVVRSLSLEDCPRVDDRHRSFLFAYKNRPTTMSKGTIGWSRNFSSGFGVPTGGGAMTGAGASWTSWGT